MDAGGDAVRDHCQTTPYAGGGVARSRYNPSVNCIQERA